MNLYAHLSIDAGTDVAAIVHRPESTVIKLGPDEWARLSSPLPIYVNGTPAERAAFLVKLAGSLDEAAALLLADGAA